MFKVSVDKTVGKHAQLHIAFGRANWFSFSKEQSVAM